MTMPHLYAQTTLEQLDNARKKRQEQKTTVVTTTLALQEKDSTSWEVHERTFPDVSRFYSEYYASIVNQYGFWKGVGPKLTPTQVRHLNKCYRLLRPAGLSANAPFTHMQVVNSFGRLVSGSYAPHLASLNDEGVLSEWKGKLETICQAEKISQNGVMTQENMYDADGNLVLQYFLSSVSKNHTIGHYTDAYGGLAQLRIDEEANYVSIILDENGHEAEISFVDKDGHPRRNDDDAFMQLREYDKEGCLLFSGSADILGRPMIDNYGNCGWTHTFDAYGHELTATCVDQHRQPMKMPDTRSDQDVENIRYTYDVWGNNILRAYFNHQGQPVATSKGVHRYIFTYNDRGQRTSCRAEDLEGHLVNFNEDLAMWENHYNKQGKLTYSRSVNADSLLCSRGDCITIIQYAADGRQVLREDYHSINGSDSLLNYRHVTTAQNDSVWDFNSDYAYVESMDDQGRIVSKAYYNVFMQPIHFNGYHKYQHEYTDRPHYSRLTERWLDEQGRPASILNPDYKNNFNVRVEEVDSLTRTKTFATYDGDHLAEKYSLVKNKDYTATNAIMYYDSLGCRGRSHKADAFYYKALSAKNYRGNSTSWRGENEFGELSYILTGDWSGAALYCHNIVGDPYYYDENGDTIPSSYAELVRFKNSLYKSICIELVDSVALRLGLRSGDLIVRYGDWQYPQPQTQGRYYEIALAYESVKKALHPKTVIVLRHDPDTHTSRLVQLTLPPGTPRELGFIYHLLFMTQREYQRYLDTVSQQLDSVQLSVENVYEAERSAVSFILPYKIGGSGSSYTQVFSNGFQDNAVVLAWEAYRDGNSYLFPFNGPIGMERVFSLPYDSVALHYTVDGVHTLRYVFTNDTFRYDVYRSSTYVADASAMQALADSLQLDYSLRHPLPSAPVLSPRQAAARLLKLPGTLATVSSGSDYAGQEPYQRGDIEQCQHYAVTPSALSYDQLIQACGILGAIDYSDYVYFRNAEYSAYLKPASKTFDTFDEMVWSDGDSIVFLTGNIATNPVSLVVGTVDNSGHFADHGLQGDYVILQCNDWQFCRSGEHDRALRGNGTDPRRITLAPILGEGDDRTLGPIQTIEFPPQGMFGITCGWQEVPSSLFVRALQLFHHVKLPKKKKKLQ